MLLLFCIAFATALMPLELPDGSPIMLGTWYDRLNGQTPKMINERLNVKPLSIWHSDVNITSTLQADYFENIIQQVRDSGTDALVYVTVYPMEGFDRVSEAALRQLIDKVSEITSTGSKLFIRYAPEMVLFGF